MHEIMGEARTNTDRRQLALIMALTGKKPVPRAELRRVTPEVAELYAGKTTKTLTRDLNALRAKDLIRWVPGQGYIANNSIILAYLPDARAGDKEAQVEEAERLIDAGGQLRLFP